MNRTVAGVLFVVASLLGGPLVFLAASTAVVNAVRGLFLALPALFNDLDYRLLVHAVPLAIALGLIYGVVRGTTWLAQRAVGIPNSILDERAEFERANRWLTVLLTLFAVALVLAVGLGLWLRGQDVVSLVVVSDLGSELLAVVAISSAYMPISLAVFAMGQVRAELLPPEHGQVGVHVISLLGPPLVLVVWLVLQGFSGGLF